MWDPQIFLFGLIFTLCFHHSKLKNFELSDGNRKQEIGVFSFWELSFSGIFVKLSKEWDPPVWLVPSSNVSLQPILLCHFSFFIFFFFYPELSLLTNPELSFSFLCDIRERARPDFHLGKANKGFEKQCWTEPKWDLETRGPRDWKLCWW